MAIEPEQIILNDLLQEINSKPLSNNIRILKKFNKFILIAADPVKLKFTPSSKESSAGLALFSRDASHPVVYNTIPNKSELKRPVSLLGAKSSSSQAPLGIYPLKSKKNLKVSISPLKNADGKVFPAANIKLFKVRHLFSTVDQYVYTPVPMGLAPLSSGDKINLRKGISDSIIIEASIPATIPAGTYRGSISIGKLKKAIELKIVNFQLKKAPRQRMNWGFYVSRHVMAKDFKFMAEHGCNTAVIMSGLDNKFTQRLKAMRKAGIDGTLVIDVGALDKYIQQKPYTAQWRKLYMDKVKKFDALMKKNNENNAYIGMIHDEPREKRLNPWNRTYKQTMIYNDLIGKAAPGMKRGANPMSDEITKQYPKGLYTELVKDLEMIMPHYWAKSKYTIAAANANPKCSLWSYNDGDNRLAWGLHSWKVGIHGRTQYHYRPYSTHEHPLSPVFMGNSEFEGRSFTGNYVISWKNKLWSTVRFKALRDGITDYHYVYTLEQLIKQNPKSPVAAKAKKYLAELKIKIPEYAHATNFTEATEAGVGEVKTSLNLSKIRQKIADFCEKLTK